MPCLHRRCNRGLSRILTFIHTAFCAPHAGYNFYGTETLYSGVSGKMMEAEIFMGVVYYQRLRHMVSDKYQVARAEHALRCFLSDHKRVRIALDKPVPGASCAKCTFRVLPCRCAQRAL